MSQVFTTPNKQAKKGTNLSEKRWFFVLLAFLFLVYREFGRQLVNQITLERTNLFNINHLFVNIHVPSAVLVSALFYFVWGYLFDRHQRRIIFGIVGFIWGVSSILMGIAPTYGTFLVSKMISDITLASYSGIISLLGDLFKSYNRGKILGLFMIAYPFSLFLGAFIIPTLLDEFNWRVIIFGLAIVGFIFSLFSHLFIRDFRRGSKEPALTSMEIKGDYIFDIELSKSALFQKSLIIIYIFGLLNFVPWALLTTWTLDFLRSASINPEVSGQLSIFLVSTLIMMTLGFPVGGISGDLFFQKNKVGRVVTSILGVLLSIISLVLVYYFRYHPGLGLLIPLLALGFFMASVWPNIFASMMDITLPEFRASAGAIIFIFQTIGGLFGPIFVNLLYQKIGLIGSTTWVSVSIWTVCLILLFVLQYQIPKDIEQFRRHMAYRSWLESNLKRTAHSQTK
jgi:MFS family permease